MNALVRSVRRSAPATIIVMVSGGLMMLLNHKIGNAIVAAACWWMLLVPCGMKQINKDRLLWLLRQAYFFTIGALTALSLFK